MFAKNGRCRAIPTLIVISPMMTLSKPLRKTISSRASKANKTSEATDAPVAHGAVGVAAAAKTNRLQMAVRAYIESRIERMIWKRAANSIKVLTMTMIVAWIFRTTTRTGWRMMVIALKPARRARPEAVPRCSAASRHGMKRLALSST